MLKQYFETFKFIFCMAYLFTGIACAIGGFIFGYLFCYRNPPQSLLDKAKNIVK